MVCSPSDVSSYKSTPVNADHHPSFISSRIYIYIVRIGWTGSQPWASPSTLASCRQGRGLDANRVTVMVVLATRRRLAPSGQQTSRADGPATRARDEHACCGSIPRFSVRAQEAGPRHSAVKFQCGLQPAGFSWSLNLSRHGIVHAARSLLLR